MAEARSFNFNEVAKPEEKDFQVANKMLFKEGYDSAKPGTDAGSRNTGDTQTPNAATPQKDFAPPGQQKIQGYPTPQIELFDDKKANPAAKTEDGKRINAEPPKDTTPRIQAPETPKAKADVLAPSADIKIPTPTAAPRAEQKAHTKHEKDHHGPDPSKAKPFSTKKPHDGKSLAPGECVKGTASHYGDEGLYGEKTASGERLKKGVPTIALPHYNNQKEKPYNVVLHNPKTGQEITARVNDMGPNLRLGRAADLESATFRKLFKGADGLAQITVCRPK